MNKSIVIYQSKYGTTERYARWIAEELNGAIVPYSRVTLAQLENYQNIVFGGAVYIGETSGTDFFKKYAPILKTKRLFLFTVGISDPAETGNQAVIRQSLKKQIPSDIYDRLHIYHFSGALDFETMTFAHRTIMKMIVGTLKRTDVNVRTPEDNSIIEAYGKSLDLTNRADIYPLIEAVRAV